ncbi:MAG: S8 family serine peptidase [Phycisphaerales bacterium]
MHKQSLATALGAAAAGCLFIALSTATAAPSPNALASPMAPAPARGAAGDATLSLRSYKDEVIRPLDVAHIAVHAPGAAARDGMNDRLAALGIGANRAAALSHGDLFVVELPEGDRSPAAVRAAVAGILADPRVPFATPVVLDERNQPTIPLPSIFVGFADDVTPVEAAAIVAGVGAGRIQTFDRQPGNIHEVAPGARNGFDALAAANALAAHPRVKFAECDRVIRIEADYVPNDPGFGNCWQLSTGTDIDVNAPEAWDVTEGSSSVIVAILDCGVQQNHPDIHQLTPGEDETSLAWLGFNGGPIFDYDNHGTSVAGLVSAYIDNSLGGVGVCPGCRTLAVKIAYDDDPDPFWTSQDSWVADGIYDAQSRGARITNSSFFMGSSAITTTAYSTTSGSMLHFASAGNGGDDGIGDPSLSYPASLAACQAVAALNSSGTLTSFSNWGAGLDFAAPGTGTYTTDRTGSAGYASGDYTYFSGTSAASPIAAGVAALIWSGDTSKNAGQILSIMQSTAKDLGPGGYDTTYGYGIPRAYPGVLQTAFEPECGAGGNCYDSNGGPGCSVQSCCYTVCTADSYCCNVTWDGICANEAIDFCTSCGSPGAGACFASHGGGGCQSSACCSSVCEIDSYCCNNNWDGICVGEAWDLCTPESDTCGGAIALATGVPYSFNTSNANTDGIANDGCDFFGDDQIWKDVWFSWTATCGGYMTVSTCGTASFDTKLAVYGPGIFGITCPSTSFFSGVLLACNDDFSGCSTNSSKITIAVDQGTTYKIRAGGYNGASGEASILVTCGIPNDTCATALPIYDGTTYFSNIGAASDGPSIPSCNTAGYDQIGADVWFSYVASCTGNLLISTCDDADFDTKIALYGPNGISGITCPGGFLGGYLAGCNDDAPGCTGFTSELTVSVVQGKSYKLRVGGYQGAQGHGHLTLQCYIPCQGDYDHNGVVDGADLGLLLGQWGTNGNTDLNGDGIVNGADLGLLLGAWGACS